LSPHRRVLENLVKKFPAFKEQECSFQCSREPATIPHPDPNKKLLGLYEMYAGIVMWLPQLLSLSLCTVYLVSDKQLC
jgi:hypothetical protein